MKIGNVSQTVLKRTVLKQLHTKREEVVLEPSVTEVCAGLRPGEDEQVILAEKVIFGDEKNLAVFAIAHVLNDLYTRGARPTGVLLTILLPPHAYESRLKSMVQYAEEAAEEQGIQIMRAKVEVSPVITKAIVTATGVGLVREDELHTTQMGTVGQQLILVGHVGVEGMLRILEARQEELAERFVPTFLNQMGQMRKELFAAQALTLALQYGATAMQQIGEGGIWAALWNLAEASNTGLQLDLKKILIRQETIEVCEYFHLNPYQMTSAGCILLTMEDGASYIEALRAVGIDAAVIGMLQSGNDRIICNGEEKRYLDRPGQDELLKLEW